MFQLQTTLLLSLLLLFSAKDADTADFCSIQNKVIHDGELLTFKVYYNLSAIWVPAGEATFSTKSSSYKGKNIYHIIGEGSTYPSYDWIFKVRDKYETYIDQQTLLPLVFKRDVSEGSTKFNNLVLFDREENLAYSGKKKFKTSDCVQDVLSAIFYARNIDYNKLKPGSKVSLDLFLDNEMHSSYIRYHGKEEVKTKYGTFRAIKISPLLLEGTIFKEGEKMMIWVSDDENHVPLRVESPILVGSIVVDLIDYSNLRYDLSSLIQKK